MSCLLLLAGHLVLLAACPDWPSVFMGICFVCYHREEVWWGGQRVSEVNGKSAKPKSHTHPSHITPLPSSLSSTLSQSPPSPSPLQSCPSCLHLSPSRCPWSCGPAQWWTCPLYISDCFQRHVPGGWGRGQEKERQLLIQMTDAPRIIIQKEKNCCDQLSWMKRPGLYLSLWKLVI